MTASKIQMDQIRSTSATDTGENILAGSQKKSSLSPAEGLQGGSPDATCACPSGDRSLRHPCPAHPAVEQAGGDERAAFEAAYQTEHAGFMGPLKLDRREDGEYKSEHVGSAWRMWKARAALAQPSPVQAEQAEAERPEVVGYLLAKGNGTLSILRAGPSDEPVMTVAQYERIAASRWERAMDLMGDHVARISDKLTAERDAALARCAKLEHSQSFQSDIDYSVLSEYAYKHRLHFNNLCAVVRSALIALPAQAQHSVPEEFSFEYRHPNGECHTVTVSREQVINEMPDFLFEALCSKFCNCEPVGETNVVECCCDEYAEEFKLIAAAPGKEVGHE